MSLPTPRTLLTSLINSLTSTNLPQQAGPQDRERTHKDSDENVFKSICPAQKALLATLHVIIPPPTLLQALDLLDRGLVTRVTCSPTSSQSDALQSEEKVRPPQANEDLRDVDVVLPDAHTNVKDDGNDDVKTKSEGNGEKRKAFYLVKSSQAPRSRYRDRISGDGEGVSYIVRLQAWNCTCAAFAFSSFPGSSSSPSVPFRESGDEDGWEARGEWEYGGESLNGRKGEAVPVCKHLLACVLAERWEILEGVVSVREVEREEVVGLSV